MHVHHYMSNTYNGIFYQRNPFVCRFSFEITSKNAQAVYTVAEGGSQLFWIWLL